MICPPHPAFRLRSLGLAACLILLATKGLRAEATAEAGTPLAWSRRMADSQIKRFGGEGAVYKESRKWDYALHVTLQSFLKLSVHTGDDRYAAFVENSTRTWVRPDGTINGYDFEELSLDNIAPGRTLLALYQRTGDERYKKAADTLRSQLEKHPRTSKGGFWHKKRYPNQMWLDGLYMGEPFYAQDAQWFGRGQDDPAWNDIARQFQLIHEHLYDPKTGLCHHGWDEAMTQKWANKETGASASFWARAEGWWIMALVETLEYFPPDHPARAGLARLLKKTADGIVRWQDTKTGLWWQVLDQGDRQGNYLEGTASAMFVYALARAANDGVLPRDVLAPARRGYAGLLGELIRTDDEGNVDLTQCCKVAGLGGSSERRDGSFAYYISEPVVENDLKGVGPFILAGLEFDRLGIKENFAAKPAVVGWDAVPSILARIKPPQFAPRDVSILDHGAVGDGKTDNTKAIRQAIEACAREGGGRVVFPPGEWLTGAIRLKSNVNLHVGKGATLRFDPDPKKYPRVLTRFEGVECMNYSPFIYAFEQENVAVTGEGTLDGGADDSNWWGWVKKGDGLPPPPQRADRDHLNELGEAGTPVEQRVFGEGHFLRPNFIQPYRCKNVLVEGVTIHRSPMWEVHPVLCTNVTVRGVTVESLGPNNDGCDPESSRDVLIENCTFNTGDDCIAIKSGRNNDGRRVNVPSENIVVRGCRMANGHGGVTIGSEISGGCRNVFAEDCKMDSPALERALRLKTNARRGGFIENVFMRNVEIGQVKEAVLAIDFHYEEGEKGDYLPVVRNVVLENVSSKKSRYALKLAGFAKAPIRGVTIRNCVFSGVGNEDLVENVEDLSKTNVTVERKN